MMKITKVNYTPLHLSPGIILISDPFIKDAFFERTVVLLTGHSEEDGSVGFVMNRFPDVYTNEVVSEYIQVKLPVFHGGPVEEDTFHFIYKGKFALTDSVPVTNEMYWGGDLHELNNCLLDGTIKPSDVRCFLGYTGWAEGQLQEEINQSAWITKMCLHASPLFQTKPQDMWGAQIKSMGRDFEHLANAPENPEWN